MEREDLGCWLRLSESVAYKVAYNLLKKFGSPQLVFSQNDETLRKTVNVTQIQRLLKPNAYIDNLIDRTWKWLHNSNGIVRQVLTINSEFYPDSLRHIADPPILLYLEGNWAQWCQLIKQAKMDSLAKILAIVGSRKPTAQGKIDAHQFAMKLVRNGWTIVSGLALGIDAAAHTGSLEGVCDAELLRAPSTIAVFGTGLDQIYPRNHMQLAGRIIESGVLISEYPLGTPPKASNFPKRNRIISGLSRGVLVVESTLRSGSLITARAAVEQGREVFAIPGSIYSQQSGGCNFLIRQGAVLTRNIEDIFAELKTADAFSLISQISNNNNPASPSNESVKTKITENSIQAQNSKHNIETSDNVASGEASKIEHYNADDVNILRHMGLDVIAFDVLAIRTGKEASYLQSWLLKMELQGAVARLPGGMLQRLIQNSS